MELRLRATFVFNILMSTRRSSQFGLTFSLGEGRSAPQASQDSQPGSFEISRMQRALNAPRSMIPNGLTPQELLDYLVKAAKKVQ